MSINRQLFNILKYKILLQGIFRHLLDFDFWPRSLIQGLCTNLKACSLLMSPRKTGPMRSNFFFKTEFQRERLRPRIHFWFKVTLKILFFFFGQRFLQHVTYLPTIMSFPFTRPASTISLDTLSAVSTQKTVEPMLSYMCNDATRKNQQKSYVMYLQLRF